jgi:hypothetical protein
MLNLSSLLLNFIKLLLVSVERKTAGTESKFVRSFSINPNTVDFDNMKANLEYGVLTSSSHKLMSQLYSDT